MPADAASIESRPGPDAPRHGPKFRLLTLAELDKRTSAARRAHDLIGSVTADLGGLDRLATGERQIVQRAAMIGTMAEDIEARWLLGEPVDATVLCTLANAQRRLFESVGLQRRSRNVTPSVDEYVATTATDEESSAA
jgi:hypothetical protein